MATLSHYYRVIGLMAFLFLWMAIPERLPAEDASTSPSGGFSNYQNTPVNSILDIYEQLSGRHLIRDSGLVNVPPVSINATGLNKAEMLKLIEATLLLNGAAIVPVDDKNAKVIMVGSTKNPRSEGLKIYANAADLPENDQVVSYFMPLSYITPEEAQAVFMQQAPPHPFGVYVPVPSSEAIVLTESTSVLRQLIALKELIDVPPAPVSKEFIQLNRADAEKVAVLLNQLLDQKATPGAPNQPNAGTYTVPARIGNTEPLLNEHNLISGPAQIVPIPRSNQILVITRAGNLPFLKELITQMDQPDIYLVPQRRPLRYVSAQDILPALEAALAQGKDELDQIKKDQPTNSSSNSQSSGGGGGGISSSGNGQQGISQVTSPLKDPDKNNAPTVVTIGKTRLLADNRSNSIIIFGSPDMVARSFSMIDELDRKPMQVYLATVIGQLSVSEGMEFGIDILQNFQKVGQGGLASSLVSPGTTKAGSSAVPSPSSLTSPLGFPLPTGLTLYGAIGSTLNAYVRALETTSRFKIISRPSVYTTNNTRAVIASGSQIPVPASTTSGFTGSSSDLTTTSSIVYENVLLELDIIPLINANHEVTLKIRQTNNSEGTSQVISGNSVPTILTQEINTEVTVPDKSTIVIGGLIADNTNRGSSGVPYLSDIPILGYLFSDTSKKKDRNELIIMIQPTVIATDADQIYANEIEKQRTILGREAMDAANATVKTTTTTTTSKVTTIPAPTPGNPKPAASTKTTVTVKKTTTDGPVKLMAPDGSPGIVPAMSTPAPDVSNGNLPKDAPAKTPSSTH